jgi:hypothetical protein
MTIRILALSGAFVFATVTAALADDPMAGTYGNTVTSKSEKTSAVAMLYFNADMTYTVKATDPKGQPVGYGGAWALKDNGASICLTPNLPPNTPGAGTSCSPLTKHAVGDNWKTTNDMGETFDLTLSAGH